MKKKGYKNSSNYYKKYIFWVNSKASINTTIQTKANASGIMQVGFASGTSDDVQLCTPKPCRRYYQTTLNRVASWCELTLRQYLTYMRNEYNKYT
jgi:hypothetical protein